MGGGFIMLSPKLRELVGNGSDGAATMMNDYSPFACIGAAIGLCALFTLSMHKSGRS